MGIVVGFTSSYEGDVILLVSFFASALGMVLLFDILKIFSAYKVKRYLQSRNIIWINRIAGV